MSLDDVGSERRFARDDDRSRVDDGLQTAASHRRLPLFCYMFNFMDPRMTIRGIYLLLGVGVLLPWNAFISAKSYFSTRLCDPANPSEHQNGRMESTFALTYNLSSVLSMGLLLGSQWIVGRISTVRTGSEIENTSLVDHGGESEEFHSPSQEETALRHDIEILSQQVNHVHEKQASSVFFVMLPMSIFLLAFLGQAFLVLSVQVSSAETIRIITYSSLVICGVSSVMVTAGIVESAGRFRDSDMAMNPFLAGQSVGGLAVSLANFLVAVSENPDDFRKKHCNPPQIWPLSRAAGLSVDSLRTLGDIEPTQECNTYDDIDFGVFCYFILGAVLLLACLVGYSWIDRLCDRFEDDIVAQAETYGTMVHVEESPRIGLELSDPQHEIHGQNSSSASDLPESNAGGMHESHSRDDQMVQVLLFVRSPVSCILLTFFVTLSLFPGLTSELRSTRQCESSFRLMNDLYTPFSFVLFNVGDLVGRLLAGRSSFLSKKLVTVALLRFLLFPLMFFCPSEAARGYQVSSDLFSFLVQLLFAVSNGALLTAAFAHAPALIPEDENMEKNRHVMSEMMSFSVAVGLLSGSLFSFQVSKLSVN